MDSQGQGDCPARLLQTPGTLGFNGRARQTAKQLYKHRLVTGLVRLITDVSVLRNVVIKGCGMISVHSGQCSITLRMLTLTCLKTEGCFHFLYYCYVIVSPFDDLKDVLWDIHACTIHTCSYAFTNPTHSAVHTVASELFFPCETVSSGIFFAKKIPWRDTGPSSVCVCSFMYIYSCVVCA